MAAVQDLDLPDHLAEQFVLDWAEDALCGHLARGLLLFALRTPVHGTHLLFDL